MPFPTTARYFINFRKSDTGLTPIFTFFREAVSPFNAVAPPTVTERSDGMYFFDWTWTTGSDVDIIFELDGGASIPTEEVRYVKGVISPRDRFVDEPVSQVKDDVWNDSTNRAVGTKGDFVEHIGLDTDAVDDPTVFGKVYKARDAVMGGTGFGGTGVDVKTTYDRVGAPLGGFSTLADQLGDPSGSNSIAQDIAALQTTASAIDTKIGTPVATVSTDIAAVKAVVDAINTETDPTAIADAVWDAATTGNVTPGTMGGLLDGTHSKIGTPVTSVSADIAAVRGVDNRDLTDITGSGWTASDSLHQIKLTVDSINVETDPAAIANAVWNELITGHQTADSMGRVLNDVFRVLKNKAVINATTKQLEVYDDAGASVIFTFDLKDENGVSSATRIFRRLPL